MQLVMAGFGSDPAISCGAVRCSHCSGGGKSGNWSRSAARLRPAGNGRERRFGSETCGLAPLRTRVADAGQDLSPATFGLRADRRKEIAQHAPHSVQLIDEIEDDGNAVLVHAESRISCTRARSISENGPASPLSRGSSQPASIHASSVVASRCAARRNSRRSMVTPPSLHADCEPWSAAIER